MLKFCEYTKTKIHVSYIAPYEKPEILAHAKQAASCQQVMAAVMAVLCQQVMQPLWHGQGCVQYIIPTLAQYQPKPNTKLLELPTFRSATSTLISK